MREHPLLTATIFGLALVSVACGGQETTSEPELRPVRTVVVSMSGAERSRTFSGTFRAGMESRLSFRVPGRVQRLTVSVGQSVPPGYLIAQLDSLADAVETALADTQLDACMTELEITENVAMQNIESTIATLTRLKQMGIRIAMDDFGTGYSSLGYLRRLPVDMLKIDQSFVHGIPESKEDALIAQAIIAMARSLNLSLVVEGIENARQLRFFRQQGCDIVQGYLFSEPVNAAEMLKILDTHSTPGTINLFN